jgi:hypothetical protein
MKKYIVAAVMMTATSAFAATNNVGCGIGSMIFAGQSGMAQEVLAVTTNGTLGNQTFGISSGTLGCGKDGVVPDNKTAMLYLEGNQDRLAREMATGQGESVAGLASVIRVSAADSAAFSAVMKENYSKIFTQANVSSVEVLANIKQVLASNETLQAYSNNI